MVKAFTLFFSGICVAWSSLHIALEGGSALLAIFTIIVGGAMMFGALFLAAGKP